MRYLWLGISILLIAGLTDSANWLKDDEAENDSSRVLETRSSPDEGTTTTSTTTSATPSSNSMPQSDDSSKSSTTTTTTQASTTQKTTTTPSSTTQKTTTTPSSTTQKTTTTPSSTTQKTTTTPSSTTQKTTTTPSSTTQKTTTTSAPPPTTTTTDKPSTTTTAASSTTTTSRPKKSKIEVSFDAVSGGKKCKCPDDGDDDGTQTFLRPYPETCAKEYATAVPVEVVYENATDTGKAGVSDVVTKNQYPFYMSLFMTNDRSVGLPCGGALVSDRVVLTVAACFFDSQNEQFKEVHVMDSLNSDRFAPKFDIWLSVNDTVVTHKQFNPGDPTR
ncbi:hypothetical protein ANTRET_LOCUS10825 [Anthophora retusa]